MPEYNNEPNEVGGHFLVRLARSWLGHLGASLDRDLASPGLLGVREDGPAGGGTWGVRPAERRLPNGPPADVSCPRVPGGQNFPGPFPQSFVHLRAGRGPPGAVGEKTRRERS